MGTGEKQLYHGLVQDEEDTRLDLNGKSSSDHHEVRLVTYKM